MAAAAKTVALLLLGIDVLAPRLTEMAALLSEDELARAGRFRFERDRVRFTLGRAALRHALAAACGMAPESLQFVYGAQGKPALADWGGGAELCFNASGSDGTVAIALARGAALGVDVERPRPRTDWQAIAERFFAGPERRELARLAPEDQEAAFYRGWTLKEAAVKFTGRGLSLGLDSFAVSIAPDRPPEIARWSPADLAPPGALWTRPLTGGAHVSLACTAPEIAVGAGEAPPALKDAVVAWQGS